MTFRAGTQTKRLAELLRGVAINGVVEGSPVDLAGLRGGDIILAANGFVTSCFEELMAAEDECDLCTVLRVWRDGVELDLVVLNRAVN